MAIIHCISSRDENAHPYCSRVCCMYSLKQAHQVREKTGAEVYDFYMDMRAFGKAYEEFYARVQEEGITFIRGRGAEVEILPDGKLRVRSEDADLGRLVMADVDMVVLWPQAEVIGTPVEGAPPNPIVAEYEGMSLEGRRTFWREQFLKCIKCYGCRNICPECFCEACALDDPLWVERGVLAPPFPMYHLIRAMHMAGRCVACRQCELTCPSHIPLTVLYDLIRRDVGNLLGYVPGADIEAAPPLSLTLEDAPLQHMRDI